jgi:hypothetical protein
MKIAGGDLLALGLPLSLVVVGPGTAVIMAAGALQ